jgi:hypothetical protein
VLNTTNIAIETNQSTVTMEGCEAAMTVARTRAISLTESEL